MPWTLPRSNSMRWTLSCHNCDHVFATADGVPYPEDHDPLQAVLTCPECGAEAKMTLKRALAEAYELADNPDVEGPEEV